MFYYSQLAGGNAKNRIIAKDQSELLFDKGANCEVSSRTRNRDGLHACCKESTFRIVQARNGPYAKLEDAKIRF